MVILNFGAYGSLTVYGTHLIDSTTGSAISLMFIVTTAVYFYSFSTKAETVTFEIMRNIVDKQIILRKHKSADKLIFSDSHSAITSQYIRNHWK